MAMRLVLLSIAAGLISVSAGSAHGAIIYESATGGFTGVVGGFAVDSGQFLGVKFQLAAQTNVQGIGGHFGGNGGQIFGAIVKLTSISDFPDSLNLSTPDVLGTTLISVTPTSQHVSGALNLNLAPGSYAIVFGSGLFGATANGYAPNNSVDVGSPFYIRTFAPLNLWGNAVIPGVRMFVEGTPSAAAVPEPATLMMFGLGALGFFAVALRRRERSA